MSTVNPSSSLRAAPLAVQLLLLIALFVGIAFAPPTRGAMLLLPLTSEARTALPRLAVGHGALLLGQGPVVGSLLVRGERAPLAEALMRHGVLLLSAPEFLCGDAGGRGSKA